MGAPYAWRLDSWIDENVWESEDGSSRTLFDPRADYEWDEPLCWLDADRVAISGRGDHYDDEDGSWVRIYSMRDAPSDEHWIYPPLLSRLEGPAGELFGAGDRLLAANEEGLSVWEVETGTLAACIEGFSPSRQHRSGRYLVEVGGSGIRYWRY
jgi:hypothetical protein